MDIWDAVFDFFGPLADLTYQSFYDKDGNFSVAELIKTLAALIALIGAIYGLYKTAILSFKGLEKIIDDYMEKHKKIIVKKRKELFQKLDSDRTQAQPVGPIDVEAFMSKAITLQEKGQLHRASGILKELERWLSSKRNSLEDQLALTKMELSSTFLMMAELNAVGGAPKIAFAHVDACYAN